MIEAELTLSAKDTQGIRDSVEAGIAKVVVPSIRSVRILWHGEKRRNIKPRREPRYKQAA